ncbi:MAG: XTP/dITP diphosphatase [Candidatus Diapherotrites archaeon]|nr:XTP/dITP diphosphatase [Candidatus Diapherotrites archaeon]
MYFITSNKNKVEEARKILGDIRWKRMDVPEIQSNTIEEIAKESARYAFSRIKKPLFVEDAGLFMKALAGFPGPYSKYVYNTIGCKGIIKLMRGVQTRDAEFRAAVAYADKRGRIHVFVGRVNGTIATSERGNHGFGFDPIFIPRNKKKTFAQDPEYKAKISHRTKALLKLKAFLEQKVYK